MHRALLACLRFGSAHSATAAEDSADGTDLAPEVEVEGQEVVEAGPPDMTKPVKGCILSGQSNMVGFGRPAGDGPGTAETWVRKVGKFTDLVDADRHRAAALTHPHGPDAVWSLLAAVESSGMAADSIQLPERYVDCLSRAEDPDP